MLRVEYTNEIRREKKKTTCNAYYKLNKEGHQNASNRRKIGNSQCCLCCVYFFRRRRHLRVSVFLIGFDQRECFSPSLSWFLCLYFIKVVYKHPGNVDGQYTKYCGIVSKLCVIRCFLRLRS